MVANRGHYAAALVLSIVAGWGAVAYAGDEDARQWLARTDAALTTRNYEGVFVHEHAGQTETLQVIHRVNGEQVAERLLSMDGSGREFIRQGTQLICYLPDRHEVLVEHSSDAGVLLSGLPRINASSVSQYEIKQTARTRVSGRSARVITVTPMDDLRYGYRLWIDEATAMPLKSQLRDADGRVVDQIVFTSLRLPAHISDAMLLPAVDARGYRWIRRDRSVAVAATPGDAASMSWQAEALPPGFHMTVDATQLLPGVSSPVQHMVFSDGLASVSVFIETTPSADSSPSETLSLGSSSLYSTVISGYRITAIGEVPPDTVRVIAHSIRTAGKGEAATGTFSASVHAHSSAAVPGTNSSAAAPAGTQPASIGLSSGDALLEDVAPGRAGLGLANGGDPGVGGPGDAGRGLGVGAQGMDEPGTGPGTGPGPGPGSGPGPGPGPGLGGGFGGGPGLRGPGGFGGGRH